MFKLRDCEDSLHVGVCTKLSSSICSFDARVMSRSLSHTSCSLLMKQPQIVYFIINKQSQRRPRPRCALAGSQRKRRRQSCRRRRLLGLPRKRNRRAKVSQRRRGSLRASNVVYEHPTGRRGRSPRPRQLLPRQLYTR